MFTYGKFAVPDITGKTKQEAETILAQAGLTGVLDGADGSHSDSYKALHDKVKLQVPPANSDIPANKVVKYHLYKYLGTGQGDHVPPIDNRPGGKTGDLVGVFQGQVQEVRQRGSNPPRTFQSTVRATIELNNGVYTLTTYYVPRGPAGEDRCEALTIEGNLVNSSVGTPGAGRVTIGARIVGAEINADETWQMEDGTVFESRRIWVGANQASLGIRATHVTNASTPQERETTTIIGAINRVVAPR